MSKSSLKITPLSQILPSTQREFGNQKNVMPLQSLDQNAFNNQKTNSLRVGEFPKVSFAGRDHSYFEKRLTQHETHSNQHETHSNQHDRRLTDCDRRHTQHETHSNQQSHTNRKNVSAYSSDERASSRSKSPLNEQSFTKRDMEIMFFNQKKYLENLVDKNTEANTTIWVSLDFWSVYLHFVSLLPLKANLNAARRIIFIPRRQ